MSVWSPVFKKLKGLWIFKTFLNIGLVLKRDITHHSGSFGCCRHEWVNMKNGLFCKVGTSWIVWKYLIIAMGVLLCDCIELILLFRYFVMYSLLLVCKDNWLQWENQLTFLHSKKTTAFDNQMNIFLLCKYPMQILLLKTLPLKPTWPCKIK